MLKRLYMDLQATKAAPQIFTRLQLNVQFSITNLRCKSALCAPAAAKKYKHVSNVGTSNLTPEVHTSRWLLVAQQVARRRVL